MAADDLRRPRLVPLEPRPVQLEDGSSAVALRDPYGVLENGVVVSPAAYGVLAHFDGERELSEVVRAVEVAGLGRIRLAEVERLAVRAREVGLVHGPMYAARRVEALAAFRSAPRAPACAGGAYPERPDELRRMLAGFYTLPGGPGPRDPTSRAGAGVRLLVAPHIDFRRGGAAYAHAYRALEGSEADLFVVFGTAHASPPHLFTLTRQDYDTPLGAVPTDRAVVDALATDLGEEELFEDELVHAGEHSCEFQMVWLRWVMAIGRSAPCRCCAPPSRTSPIRPPPPRGSSARSRAPSPGAASASWPAPILAHVGPQYGDWRAPTAEELAGLAAQDLRTLAFLGAPDPAGFHRDAILDDDQRRLCGVAPIYAALRAAGRGARLLHHAQWTDGTDMVSFAAAAG